MSWAPERLLEDVETKPAMLRGLAAALRDGTGWPDLGRPRAVLLLGIGSSRYAAEVAARRMRSEGIAATAESSSIARMSPITDDTLVVVISAGGSSAETLAAARAVSTSSRVIGLTNAPSSVLAEVVGWAVPMDAGEEVSGVASRTFTATLVRLLELEVVLTGGLGGLGGLADSTDAAAAAIDDLLAQRPSWLGEAVEALVGPDGTWLLAPLERWSSAMQGALMLREVPRRLAVGCETGEWSHVDVYLTLGREYRALVFAGSPWDAQATEWLRRRQATFWAIGGNLPGAARTLRYAADDDPIVALLAEVTVAELLAADVLRAATLTQR